MNRIETTGRHAGHCWSAGLLLVTVSIARLWAVDAPIAPVGSDKWEKEIRAFEASDRTNPPPRGGIVFVGSSSIRLWKSLAEDFPNHHVINRGFGGSQLVDSVYFADRIITPYEPRMVVIYAGGNDVNAGKEPAQVYGDFCALAAKLHANLPRARVAFISIAGNPARWAQVDRVRETNRLIRGHCDRNEGMVFIDTFSAMLGPDGLPKPDIFVEDRLHMNTKGYAIWKEWIAPHLMDP